MNATFQPIDSKVIITPLVLVESKLLLVNAMAILEAMEAAEQD